jgi:hypothetical protein
MSNNKLSSRKQEIRELPKLIDELLLKAGLTPLEAFKYKADRLMIANYLKPTANVLEIGSRPSVSIFIELNKAPDAKHIVVDNDVGDRVRLNELIKLNGMSLKVMPIEEFVDIYSYDAVIIEESEGDTAELLRDLPLDKIDIIITSEMAKNRKTRADVDETLTSEGFEKTASVTETTSVEEERVVDVYEKSPVEPIEEETVVDEASEEVTVQVVEKSEPETVVAESIPEPESQAEINEIVESGDKTVAQPVPEPEVEQEQVTMEVIEKTPEPVSTPPNTPQISENVPVQSASRAIPAQLMGQRRFAGRRRPMMRMGL